MSIHWLPCGPWPAPSAGLRCGRASPRDFELTLSSATASGGDLAIRCLLRHRPNLRRYPPRLRACRPTTPSLQRRRAANLLSTADRLPSTPGNATTASPPAGAPTASRANQSARLRRPPNRNFLSQEGVGGVVLRNASKQHRREPISSCR